MKPYKVYKNYLSLETCEYLLQKSIDTFEIDERTKGGWHARSNRDKSFESEVKDILGNIVDFSELDVTWINLSEYENGRRLKPHKDGESHLTIVCNLSDGYEGGEFIIEDELLSLGLGDVVIFNGGDYFHGVASVTKGYRASFNMWCIKIKKNML